MIKIYSLVLLLLSVSISCGKPPTTVRGPNNQVIGRIYEYNNTYRYYGKYNQPVGSSRQGNFYNQNNKYLGKIK